MLVPIYNPFKRDRKVLHLGLTDYERDELNKQRRIKNCLVGALVCFLIIAVLVEPN